MHNIKVNIDGFVIIMTLKNNIIINAKSNNIIWERKDFNKKMEEKAFQIENKQLIKKETPL